MQLKVLLLILLHVFPQVLLTSNMNDTGTWNWRNDDMIHCNKTRNYDVLVTLFTTWPLQRHQERLFVYENIMKNWKSLGPRVRVVVFTNDIEIKEFCQERNVNVLPLISTAAGGRPMVRPMYIQVMEKYKSAFYSFVNSDLLLSPTITDILDLIVHSKVCNHNPIFIMGARTNIMSTNESLPHLSSTWTEIEAITNKRGVTFGGFWSLDYYITSLHYPWTDVPDVVHGITKLDNFMIWNALRQNHTTIDITNAFLAIHQSFHRVADSGKGPEKDYNLNLWKTFDKKFGFGKIFSSGRTDCAEFVVGYDHVTKKLQIMQNRFRRRSCFNL